MNGSGRASRERAWAALSTNALVVPGLGSVLFLGRRTGWAQAALGVTGFLLSLSWLSLTVMDWVRSGALPATVPRAGLLMTGGALFAAGWLWALTDGLAALRDAVPGRDER